MRLLRRCGYMQRDVVARIGTARQGAAIDRQDRVLCKSLMAAHTRSFLMTSGKEEEDRSCGEQAGCGSGGQQGRNEEKEAITST